MGKVGIDLDGIENPQDQTIKFTAGPSQQHILSIQNQEKVVLADQMSHRSQFAKELIHNANERVFDIFNIPTDERNPDADSENGWHVCWTNSGTDGMEKAIRGACLQDDTLLVDTDNFSSVAGHEMQDIQRSYYRALFDRGDGLTSESEGFAEIVDQVKSGKAKTVYLTENGTTTGVNQKKAIEELVKERNEADSPTLIVVDAVSSQIFGAKRDSKTLPDIIFWANQKDTAIGTGGGNLLFNNRALKRAQEVAGNGLDAGGKLGIENAYGKNGKRLTKEGQTAQTPPMGHIYKQALVYQQVLAYSGQDKQVIAEMQSRAMRSITSRLCNNAGYSYVTKNPELRSPTSHVLKMPDGSDPKDPGALRLIDKLKTRGFSISSGYGSFKNEEIRICVYSANTLDQLQALLTDICALTGKI